MSNPYRLIKQLAILTGVFMVAATSVRAQQSSYYIYIQSDNGQPFYTQIGDKVYSSSTVGHLVIAGLKDNVCNLEIGFPQHTSRPQQFIIPVKGKDHGYQLKKNGSADWALYNWQNQETIKAQKGAGTSDLLYGERKKDDAFAALMAAVVNDSAVLYTSIVKNDVPEEAPVTAKNNKKGEKKPAVTELPVNNLGALDVTVVDKPLYDTSFVVAKNDKAVVDTQQVFKTDKSLFDTTTAASKVYKTDKPLFDTTTVAAKPYKADKPLFDTTTTAAKPYKADKPLFDTTAAIPKPYKTDKPLFDTTAVASVYKNDKPLYDTTTSVSKVDSVLAVAAKAADQSLVKDTATSKPVAKTPKADKKVAKAAGVVKVQQIKDKEGETKLVFIDSSESPAIVVTAYIAEEKPVQPATPPKPTSTEPVAATTVKTEEKKPDNDKKSDSGKTDIVAVKPEAKKETLTPPIVSPVSTATELPKQGELKVVTEKPVERKGDTLTIILESPQLRRDTVRLQKQEAPKPLYENTQVTQPVADTPNNLGVEEVAKAQPEEVKKDTAAARLETPKAEMPKAVVEPKAAEPEKKKIVMINSDCARFATDGEVDKLRVKMIAEKDVAKRVGVANKSFKSMCLTAKQIKGLSELFTTEETKYSFLSMAYPFAADTENFKELYQLFGEESYQTKFKTLVRY